MPIVAAAAVAEPAAAQRLLLFEDKAKVATATVGPDGAFSATARRPPRSCARATGPATKR